MSRKKYLKIREYVKNIVLTDNEEFQKGETSLKNFLNILKKTEKELISKGYDKDSIVVGFDHEYSMEGEYYGSDMVLSAERNETDDERNSRLNLARQRREAKKAQKEKIEEQERQKYEELKAKFEGSK